MSASKPGTPPFSGKVPNEADLPKMDAHTITPEEYEELPELTDEFFEQADFLVGGVLVRRGRGRPPVEAPKQRVTMRLDADVIAAMRASSPGWQVRANDVLRKQLSKAGFLGKASSNWGSQNGEEGLLWPARGYGMAQAWRGWRNKRSMRLTGLR